MSQQKMTEMSQRKKNILEVNTPRPSPEKKYLQIQMNEFFHRAQSLKEIQQS